MKKESNFGKKIKSFCTCGKLTLGYDIFLFLLDPCPNTNLLARLWHRLTQITPNLDQ